MKYKYKLYHTKSLHADYHGYTDYGHPENGNPDFHSKIE